MLRSIWRKMTQTLRGDSQPSPLLICLRSSSVGFQPVSRLPACLPLLCRPTEQASALDAAYLPAGERTFVPTSLGYVAVTVTGDRSKTPCVTVHDVGTNHETCFSSLMLQSSPGAVLGHNCCFYHIDVPGSEVQGEPALQQPMHAFRMMKHHLLLIRIIAGRSCIS